jgi:hypothetical protein
VFLEKGLSSPVTKEFTASAGGSVGTRAYAETTYVWRNQSNFIEDFIDRTNGVTDVLKNGIDYGTLTNTVYRNSNFPERHYQGLILQGRGNLRNNWIVNGNWTVELKADGNYEGESENRPGATGLIGDFPEAFTADRNFPMGRLQSFQRHRARVWSIYTSSLGRLGDLSLSGLVRLESGQVYSLAATAVPLSQIQEDRLASYPDAPTDQTLYFGKRGSETYPGYGVLDVSLNYSIPVFRSVRPWLKLDLFNALNNQKLIGYNTEVLVDPTSPADGLGRPLGYITGDRFGQAQSDTNFPGYLGMTGSRAFRMAFGLRF